MEVYKYRLWCETENGYVYVWAEEEPTSCPNNPAHTIDSSKTVIEHSVGDNSVTISSKEDESDRPYVRAESRDDHDTTVFTTKGDKWNTVTGESVGTGDGVETVFSLVNKEVKNVKVYLDDIEQESGYTVDLTQYDSGLNKSLSFSRGIITFDTAPEADAVITADYEYGEMGAGNQLIYDQTIDGDTKSIDVSFIDPIHIKDGLVAFENGALDSVLSVYAVCPQYGVYIDDRLPATGVYSDDNGNIQPAIGSEKIISRYVVDQILLGTVHVGTYFDVEARSTAMPPGYVIRFSINAGSATNLKVYARLEINRERGAIK
jgi:hypothetical protein